MPTTKEKAVKKDPVVSTNNASADYLVKPKETMYSISKKYNISKTYNENAINDFRYHAVVKNDNKSRSTPYIQMFEAENGFLENLSILDLLFMEGPNSINFMK